MPQMLTSDNPEQATGHEQDHACFGSCVQTHQDRMPNLFLDTGFAIALASSLTNTTIA